MYKEASDASLSIESDQIIDLALGRRHASAECNHPIYTGHVGAGRNEGDSRTTFANLAAE
jgi:hypothetical protein